MSVTLGVDVWSVQTPKFESEITSRDGTILSAGHPQLKAYVGRTVAYLIWFFDTWTIRLVYDGSKTSNISSSPKKTKEPMDTFLSTPSTSSPSQEAVAMKIIGLSGVLAVSVLTCTGQKCTKFKEPEHSRFVPLCDQAIEMMKLVQKSDNTVSQVRVLFGDMSINCQESEFGCVSSIIRTGDPIAKSLGRAVRRAWKSRR